jgi:hypothetical protein
MNAKQRKTLEAVFSDPPPANLSWDDVKSLLISVGCTITYRGGSRVGIGKGQEMVYAHMPHPQKEVKKHLVAAIRAFLGRIGEKP